MAKIFEFDCRDGSLRDKVTGKTLTNIGQEIVNTEKGRALKPNKNDDQYLYGEFPLLTNLATNNEVSVAFAFKTNTTSDDNILFDIGNDNNTGLGIFARLNFNAANKINITVDGTSIGSATSSSDINNGQYVFVVLTSKNNAQRLYINNILEGTASETIDLKGNYVHINNSVGGNFPFDGNLLFLKVYDNEINASERQTLYNEFLNSGVISQPTIIRPKIEHKSVDNDSGLVLFHNYENGNALDLTNNGNDGTPVGVDFGKDGAGFQASSDIDSGDIGNISSVSFLIKTESTTEGILTLDAGKTITISSGTLTYTGITASATYINGVASTSISTAKQWYWVTCVFTEVDANTFIEATKGNIKFMKVYNYARTLEQHKADYNRNVKLVAQPLVNLNADEKTYTAGQFVTNDVQVQSGSVKVVEQPKITEIDNDRWVNDTIGLQCPYDNDEANVATYGRLYNWYAVDNSKGLAPEGWHIPTDEEIKQLEMALGMSEAEADGTGYRGTNEGSKLAGRADLWSNSDLESDPEFGSSGLAFLPGGLRDYSSGNFLNIIYANYSWSSTEYNSSKSWGRVLGFSRTQVSRGNFPKSHGFSVRCVRDSGNTETQMTDIDGNVYETVTIGTQTWTTSNLKTTRYKDGTPISVFQPLPVGTKQIEQVTDGITSFPSKQAYGEWEFSVNGSETTFVFMSLSTESVATTGRQGYALYLSNRRVGLLKIVSPTSASFLFRSDANYVQNNTWYDFRITRTLDGEFTVYIKSPTDTNFPDWTLVDTTGGSGTNPYTDNTHTTSNYFVIDNDEGDRISEIKMWNGVRQ